MLIPRLSDDDDDDDHYDDDEEEDEDDEDDDGGGMLGGFFFDFDHFIWLIFRMGSRDDYTDTIIPVRLHVREHMWVGSSPVQPHSAASLIHNRMIDSVISSCRPSGGCHLSGISLTTTCMRFDIGSRLRFTIGLDAVHAHVFTLARATARSNGAYIGSDAPNKKARVPR